MLVSPWFLLLLIALGRGKGAGVGNGWPGGNGNGNGNGATGMAGQGTGAGGGGPIVAGHKLRPTLPTPTATRPPGQPMGRDCDGGEYNASYWPTQASVKGTFSQLGYPVPQRPTMNELGPNGQIGGGDDVPNPVVVQFQDDYNRMSGMGVLGNMAGGLATDGFVGACTLNGLENVLMHFDGTEWGDAIGAVTATPGVLNA